MYISTQCSCLYPQKCNTLIALLKFNLQTKYLLHHYLFNTENVKLSASKKCLSCSFESTKAYFADYLPP